MSFTFDFELLFLQAFDLAVISESSVPDKDSTEFQDKIQAAVNSMLTVMSFQPGVHRMCTYETFNSSVYKIHLTKE